MILVGEWMKESVIMLMLRFSVNVRFLMFFFDRVGVVMFILGNEMFLLLLIGLFLMMV